MTPWARTYSGRVFHPLQPRIDEVYLDDIVTPLSRIVRYNGGLRPGIHYSVAEHSVLIARLLRLQYPEDPVIALQGLMHDAAEAYIGDMVRPVKLAVPAFREIDARLTGVIFKKFTIPCPWPVIIDEYDARICLDEEAQALIPGERRFDIPAGGPLGVTLQFWEREEAREMFLLEFCELAAAARRRLTSLTTTTALDGADNLFSKRTDHA